MGANKSIQTRTDKLNSSVGVLSTSGLSEHNEYLKQKWNSFIDDCCIKDDNAYISRSELESLFAYYMEINDSGKSFITLASQHIAVLVNLGELKLTPGWGNTDGTIYTRLINGIKVVRLQK
jgi:hypothetical protein